MSSGITREPMMEMYIFETTQLSDQLEQLLIESEQTKNLDAAIDEIFRIMHTIKGTSAMMLVTNVAELSHSVEDLFYFIREKKPQNLDVTTIIDLTLEVLDFVKKETAKLEDFKEPDGDHHQLLLKLKGHLDNIKAISPEKNEEIEVTRKQKSSKKKAKFYITSKNEPVNIHTGTKYTIIVTFLEGCEMENIRAFEITHALKDKVQIISQIPKELFDGSSATSDFICENGFTMEIVTELQVEILRQLILDIMFVKDVLIIPLLNAGTDTGTDTVIHTGIDLDTDIPDCTEMSKIKKPSPKTIKITLDEGEIKMPSPPSSKSDESSLEKEPETTIATKQNYISVNISKLDSLMDLVGEIVTAEAMVTNNPDLNGMILENFQKSSRHLLKITTELQDVVMSIRMVPLSLTFQKMHRIVRDMSHKLDKNIRLDILGEETEVDKNIIEQISDPLMHLIRNSIDHGIETMDERAKKGKPKIAIVTLDAKSSGGDIFIIIKDDGRGLDRERILKKARDNGLIKKPENELTDKEIYSMILLPGFSTNQKITEYSGRGVGMDVVMKNVQKIGGTLSIDSKPDAGTTFTIKIPLTLAIINGMGIKVGDSVYTVPITSIRESFRLMANELIVDPDGNEMILIRGQCFKIIRLSQYFNVASTVTEIEKGIVMMVEDEHDSVCLFADELIGEQQVVVKPLPTYIKKATGIAGCTILGDGSVSLILNVNELVCA